MMHKKEIIRWANCPTGTKVWSKHINIGWNRAVWALVPAPSWYEHTLYIVDDEFATVRKFFADNGYAYYLNEKRSTLSFDGYIENYSTMHRKIITAKKRDTARYALIILTFVCMIVLGMLGHS